MGNSITNDRRHDTNNSRECIIQKQIDANMHKRKFHFRSNGKCHERSTQPNSGASPKEWLAMWVVSYFNSAQLLVLAKPMAEVASPLWCIKNYISRPSLHGRVVAVVLVRSNQKRSIRVKQQQNNNRQQTNQANPTGDSRTVNRQVIVVACVLMHSYHIHACIVACGGRICIGVRRINWIDTLSMRS